MAPTIRMRRIAATIASASVISLFAGATPAVAQTSLSSLVSAVSTSERQLQDLEGVIGALQEAGNRALVDLRDAQFKSREARLVADQAQEALEFATEALAEAQERLDELTRAAYRSQGGGVATTTTAGDALDRSTYLRQQVEDQREVVDELDRQRSEHANAEAEAREAERQAELREQEALDQEEAARTTIEDNSAELAAKTAERDELARQRDAVADDLAQQRGIEEEAEASESAEPAEEPETVEEVPGEEAATAVAAAQPEHTTLENPYEDESSLSSNSSDSSDTSDSTDSSEPEPTVSDSSDAIETVIARAQSQIGVPYAWGGGNANGPTGGIADGGSGDAHGDFGKSGFDCSGLVLYAFAGVGIDLPHYTGYQYLRGTPVAHSDMERGDLIFYGPGGNQHVAIYLGDGMMLEAPSSGGFVRETPVRWDGLSENAVRLI